MEKHMTLTAEVVKNTLSQVIDPNTGKDLVSSKSAKNIQKVEIFYNFLTKKG